MGKPFAQWDYDDAANAVGGKSIPLPKTGTRDYPLRSLWSRLFGNRYTDTAHNPRRPDSAIIATRMFHDDHWLDGDGFIGQLPPASLPGAASMIADIQKAFESDNVIKEVVETHVGGILGREPSWSFLPTEGERDEFSKETGETLTRWWNDRQALKDLENATQILACEGLVVRRLFFPRGKLKEGRVVASQLIDALNYIYFQTGYADQGGVFTDPETMEDIGVFLFDETNEKNEITTKCAELSFLDKNGETVCKTVKDKGDPVTYGPYPLGGRLTIYQVARDALVTPSVQSNQRSLNLAHTQMTRNVNLAGNRERTITNAQPPLPKTDKSTVTSETTKTADGRFPGTYKSSPGAVNFLMGVPIRDEDGNITGYTNPGVNISDPVSVETFERTIDKKKESIYGQSHQRHVLIVDKADTSGRAREVARREFERSLKKTKTELDACGRWQLETTLRLAAFVIGQSSKYLPLRADFNTLIDAGAPDPEMIKTALLMRQPGGMKNRPLISDETARGFSSIEDSAAEEARIDKEATLPEADLPEGLAPVPGQQTPKPATNSVN